MTEEYMDYAEKSFRLPASGGNNGQLVSIYFRAPRGDKKNTRPVFSGIKITNSEYEIPAETWDKIVKMVEAERQV